MHTLPYLVAYASMLTFVLAVIARFLKWSRMPMHMRWELYPVAHEAGKAHYGGSYLEDFEWWKKDREKSLAGELKVMLPEIFFLVALREHNKKLWFRSFPFHFGLYLVTACIGLSILGGLTGAVFPSVMRGSLGGVFEFLIPLFGWIGAGMSLFGAVGLLQRRLATPSLRNYAGPADIFNLLFFVVAFGWALLSYAILDHGMTTNLLFVWGLVTFNFVGLGFMQGLSMILLCLLLAYIPLTHMSHFIGKYFAYHAIRWNDEPNLPGGEQEKEIGKLLNQPVTWAASHIEGDGKTTWADVCTKDMNKESK
jgi:nitrate reductase gamma subunit